MPAGWRPDAAWTSTRPQAPEPGPNRNRLSVGACAGFGRRMQYGGVVITLMPLALEQEIISEVVLTQAGPARRNRGRASTRTGRGADC
ncbi:hypothetical protein DFAR_1380002 [Desulfarculales bacterium]